MINFNTKPVMTAYSEGAANCHTKMSFFKNNEFAKLDFCFGTSKTTGTYYLKNDTIYFNCNEDSSFYKYAILKQSNYSDNLGLFVFKTNDTIGYEYTIQNNEY